MNNRPPSGESHEEQTTILISGTTLVHEGHPDRNEDDYVSSPEHLMLGVFDGLGGHAGSEEAARTAARVVLDEARQFPIIASRQLAEELLRDALLSANAAVVELDRGRIGTTAAIARVFYAEDDRAFVSVASVADSRIYLYRDGELSFLSYDKGREFNEASNKTIDRQRNLASVAVRADVSALSDSSQVAFRRRNLVTSYLGQSGEMPIIVTHSVPLKPKDIILTVTDGIHDNLTDSEIAEILSTASSPDEAVSFLTSMARVRSRDPDHIRAKPDDMTAVALYYDRA